MSAWHHVDGITAEELTLLIIDRSEGEETDSGIEQLFLPTRVDEICILLGCQEGLNEFFM